MDSTKEVLLILKRRISRERTTYRKIYRESQGASKERAFGEANVCSLIIGMIENILANLGENGA